MARHLLIPLVLCSFVWNPAQATVYETVVLSGDAVQGEPAGTEYSSFGKPHLTPSGSVLSTVTLEGTAVTTDDDTAVMGPAGGGGLELYVRENDTALAGGEVFALFSRLAVNATNEIAFRTVLRGAGVTTSNDTAIFTTAGAASPTEVVREGGPAPGLAGQTITNISTGYNLANDDTLRFRATATTSGGIFTGSIASGFSLILGSNDQAPGAPVGNLVNGFSTPYYSTTGHLAVAGSVTLPTRWVIWEPDGLGSLQIVLEQGDPVPGEPASTIFGQPFGDPARTAAGDMVFHANFSGPSVPFTEALFTRVGGTLSIAARSDTPAPGTGAGVEFSSRFVTVDMFPLLVSAFPDSGTSTEIGRPSINGSGDIAFVAGLAGTGVSAANDTGIWSTAGGQTFLRAREGDAVPGLGGATYLALGAPLINALGDVMFSTTLAGAGVNAGNDFAVLVVDASGTTHVIAREGDLLEVAPSDSRTITALGTFVGEYEFIGAGVDHCCRRSFNDAQQVAFRSDFQDGSEGLFIGYYGTLAIPVPVIPAALLLVLFGGLFGIGAVRLRA